ncbi:MAG: UDP-3-O-[3-hydroxymyristoyl] N-acetylglucosamine deacetylase, partial [Phycisphaerae bacterium]|nr:UDP-3-O-[3-hydroxymyristoyl] N-acetylglucosamine deacetylase [Phycisphaerae bacterium]
MSRQRTIEKEVEVPGRGLFTGYPVTMRFRPAPAGSGVVFIRVDGGSTVRIPARIDNLTKRARRTSLRNGTSSIETVEHCLAAVRGAGIDNIEVVLDNAEVPSIDGSSLPFTEALESAGVVEQDIERQYFDVTKPTRVAEGEAEVVAWPGEHGRLDIIYELDYGGTNPIGQQVFRFTIEPETFRDEVAPARTFVTEHEAHQLRSAGLGQHLTYDDILVIGKDGPIENTFRFGDECVRHKVLDLIGDLMLAG